MRPRSPSKNALSASGTSQNTPDFYFLLLIYFHKHDVTKQQQVNRNNTIDALRLVAAFYYVRSSSFGTLNAAVADDIRLSARWAVLFFFMTTGCFLARKVTDKKVLLFGSIQKNIISLTTIFCGRQPVICACRLLSSHPIK